MLLPFYLINAVMFIWTFFLEFCALQMLILLTVIFESKVVLMLICDDLFWWNYVFVFFVSYFQTNNQVENEELCSICNVYTAVEVHPCRVCCKVFHELCLKKKGKLYDRTELEAFRKANTDKGWSCHDCVSVIKKF